jgi:hypothetical protein
MQTGYFDQTREQRTSDDTLKVLGGYRHPKPSIAPEPALPVCMELENVDVRGQ